MDRISEISKFKIHWADSVSIGAATTWWRQAAAAGSGGGVSAVRVQPLDVGIRPKAEQGQEWMSAATAVQAEECSQDEAIAHTAGGSGPAVHFSVLNTATIETVAVKLILPRPSVHQTSNIVFQHVHMNCATIVDKNCVSISEQ